jgi:hypothetical protein
MSRVVFFVLVLMRAQVMATLAMAPSTVCPEQCPDDGPDGRCPPVCLSCPASFHSARPITAPVVKAPATRHALLPVLVLGVSSDPAPSDIFHVPKRLLA